MRNRRHRVLCRALFFILACSVIACGCSRAPENTASVSDPVPAPAQALAPQSDVARAPEPAPTVPEKRPEVSGLAAEYEAVTMLLFQVSDACAARNLDKVMEYFSEDFSDDEKNSKENVRKGLESVLSMGDAILDTYRAQIQITGDQATASPVELRVHSLLMDSLNIGLKKQNGKWMVVSSQKLRGEDQDAPNPEQVRTDMEQSKFQF